MCEGVRVKNCVIEMGEEESTVEKAVCILWSGRKCDC